MYKEIYIFCTRQGNFHSRIKPGGLNRSIFIPDIYSPGNTEQKTAAVGRRDQFIPERTPTKFK